MTCRRKTFPVNPRSGIALEMNPNAAGKILFGLGNCSVCLWAAGKDGRMLILMPSAPSANNPYSPTYFGLPGWVTACLGKRGRNLIDVSVDFLLVDSPTRTSHLDP